MLDHVRFYRALGFYRGRVEFPDSDRNLGELSNEDLANAIFEELGDLSGERGSGEAPGDQVALWADKDRVWHEDLECDAIEGNGRYVEALGEWARISRGAFRPADASESWEPFSGGTAEYAGHDYTEWVTLALDVNGKPERWKVPHSDDWLNFGVLSHVNRLIVHTGFQFYFWLTGDQTACVLVLNIEERDKLKQERGADVRLFENDRY